MPCLSDFCIPALAIFSQIFTFVPFSFSCLQTSSLSPEERKSKPPSQTKHPFLIKHSFHLTFFYTIDSESKRNIRNVYVIKI